MSSTTFVLEILNNSISKFGLFLCIEWQLIEAIQRERKQKKNKSMLIHEKNICRK